MLSARTGPKKEFERAGSRKQAAVKELLKAPEHGLSTRRSSHWDMLMISTRYGIIEFNSVSGLPCSQC